jgi:hypothetical protein
MLFYKSPTPTPDYHFFAQGDCDRLTSFSLMRIGPELIVRADRSDNYNHWLTWKITTSSVDGLGAPTKHKYVWSDRSDLIETPRTVTSAGTMPLDAVTELQTLETICAQGEAALRQQYGTDLYTRLIKPMLSKLEQGYCPTGDPVEE